MSVYLGDTEIGQIYLGNTEIAEAYLGSTKIYEAGGGPTPPTPSYDAEIEFLQSSGTQYINTGVVLQDSDTFELDFEWTEIGGFVSGYNASNGNKAFMFYNTLVQWRYRVTPNWAVNTRYSTVINKTKLTANGTDFAFSGSDIPQIEMVCSTLLCAGFANNTTTSSLDSRKAKIKIYSCGIKDTNGNYRFKGKPVRVGTTGYLYDSVSGNLFGNEGTGDFILGNDKTT